MESLIPTALEPAAVAAMDAIAAPQDPEAEVALQETEKRELQEQVLKVFAEIRDDYGAFRRVLGGLGGIALRQVPGQPFERDQALLEALARRLIPEEWSWTIHRDVEGRLDLRLGVCRPVRIVRVSRRIRPSLGWVTPAMLHRADLWCLLVELSDRQHLEADLRHAAEIARSQACGERIMAAHRLRWQIRS